MALVNYYSNPDGSRQVDVPGVGGSSYPGAGGGPGMDMSWITAFAKRNAANKLRQQELDYDQDRETTRRHKGQRIKAAPTPPPAPYQMGPGQRMQQARMLVPEQTARQRAVSSQGGLSSLAYRDSMRQMQEKDLMGAPQTNYTGFTDLVQALNSGGGAAASVAAANENLQQQRSGEPEVNASIARRNQIIQQFPGLALRLYQESQQGR